MAVHVIDGKEFIETADAAEMLARSESHIRLLAKKGAIPARKIFGRWSYDREALIELAIGVKVVKASEDIENGTASNKGDVANLDL